MPSVGPSPPSHLKRKRSISDDESTTPSSPPRKVQVGPALPPTQNPDELDIDSSSSEDDFGPSAGPSTTAKPSSPPTKVPPRRVLGPALPPAPLSEMPPQPAKENSSDFGPSLPPPPGSAAEQSMLAQKQQEESIAAKATKTTKPQREEWMLVPPSDNDWTSRIDPTKLKSRKFTSGKGAKGGPAERGGGGISAIWTETPEEKRKRLEDEVLGRKEVSTSSRGNGLSVRKESEEDEATAKRIREYNEQNRGKSLLEEFKGRKGEKEQEDDPSKRAFDREKDVGLGGRIGHGQKREMLSKAKDFGSRFQKGRYL